MISVALFIIIWRHFYQFVSCCKLNKALPTLLTTLGNEMWLFLCVYLWGGGTSLSLNKGKEQTEKAPTYICIILQNAIWQIKRWTDVCNHGIVSILPWQKLEGILQIIFSLQSYFPVILYSSCSSNYLPNWTYHYGLVDNRQWLSPDIGKVKGQPSGVRIFR